jgi:branched-chain amino acid transport system substrate-binding protein
MKRRDLLLSLPAAAACQWSHAAPSEPGVQKTEILFGQTADLTASRAAITKSYSDGAGLHFAEINSAGGVAGRRLRVLQLDDGYDVNRAAENARILVEEQNVFALLHSVGTAIADRLLPYVEERGVPFVHALTGADQVRPPAHPSKVAFFLRASYGREIDRIVRQLKTLGIVNGIALIYEDEPFGHGIRDAVAQAMKASGLELQASGVLPPNQTSPAAVAPAVAALIKAKPAAIIVGSAGPSVEQFIRAYHDAGGNAQYYCLSVSNVDRLYRALGPLSQGIVIAQVMPALDTSNLPVVAEYRRLALARDTAPSTFGLEGYISARMIVKALRQSGRQPTRVRFEAELAGQSDVAGFPVKYKVDSREGSPFVGLAMIGASGHLVQ